MEMINLIEDTIKKNKYEIDCEVITPLFMGNANMIPEIREQSINGVLRWYFRAAGGAKENEFKLFGKASDKSYKGLVKLKIINKNIENIPYFGIKNSNGYNYLGFSLKMNDRQAINVGSNFKMIIQFNPFISKEHKEMFFATLWLAFNLGNFGSRSRRGFGSIKINSINHHQQKNNQIFSIDFIKNFNNQDEIIQYYKENLNKIKNIFSNSKRIDNIPNVFDNFYIYLFKSTKNNYKELLDEIGIDYKEYRRKISIEKRIIFGLPLKNFDMSKRRASLLIFKPIKSNNRYYLLVIKILPNDKNGFAFYPKTILDDKDYNIIKNFIKDKLIPIYP